jgi:hypothetical protein
MKTLSIKQDIGDDVREEVVQGTGDVQTNRGGAKGKKRGGQADGKKAGASKKQLVSSSDEEDRSSSGSGGSSSSKEDEEEVAENQAGTQRAGAGADVQKACNQQHSTGVSLGDLLRRQLTAMFMCDNYSLFHFHFHS